MNALRLEPPELPKDGENKSIERRQLAAVGVLVVASTAPFLGKAFHIDDVLYLRVAEQILRTPLDPYAGYVLWDAPDGEPARLLDTDYNPPLWKYALAAAIAVVGRSEWKLHLLTAACVALAGVAVLRLSRRWTNWPIWCGCLTLASPFFLPGQNLMLEAPMLCLALWSVEMQLRGIETGRKGFAWLSGLLIGAAILTKYTAALVLPMLVAAAVWPPVRCAPPMAARFRLLVVAVLPMAFVAAWLAHNQWMYGERHLGAHGYAAGVNEAGVRARTVVRTIGAVSVFGLALLWLLIRRAGGIPQGVACLALAGGWAWFDWNAVHATTSMQGWSPSNVERLHFLLFAFHGALIAACGLILLFRQWLEDRANVPAQSSRSSYWLAGWCAVVMAFNVVSVPFVAPRHLLLFFVPMVWLTSIWWDRWEPNGGWRGTIALASAALGCLLAASDYEIAGHYRAQALNQVARLAASTDRNVWFTGSWGFAYYATQANAKPIVAEPTKFGLPEYAAGDLVVHPALLSWGDLFGFLKKLPPAQQVDHQSAPAFNPVRTLGPNINYYAVQGHSLPWCAFVRMTGAWPYFELPPLDETLIYRLTGGR